MKPGITRSWRDLSITCAILLASACITAALLGGIAYNIYYHPRIGYTALAALVICGAGLAVWLKLEMKGADKHLMDHPQYTGEE